MGKGTNEKANRWITTAAEEIRQIKRRWKFTSNRQFAAHLQMSPRTLSKLNRLDGTLTLESVANIYGRLSVLRVLWFEGDEIMAEEQRLKDSLYRIMLSAAIVPQSLTDDVVDELEHQM